MDLLTLPSSYRHNAHARLALTRPLWRKVVLRLWLACSIVICVASAGAHLMIGLNNDHLDLMDQVRRLLAGATPYVDYADVNPPLIHLLYIAPAGLSKMLHLPIDISLNLLTLVLIGASLRVVMLILKTSGVSAGTRQITLSAVALALLAASFVHQSFADRDHLMMVLAAPWLVLYSPLARRELIPVRWRVIAAVMAALGFALKPYFYALYVVSAGFGLTRGIGLSSLLRQWEIYVITGIAVLYIAIIYAFFPEYPATMVPLLWNTYEAMYWGFGAKWAVIRDEFAGQYAVTALLGTLALLLTFRAYYDPIISYLFLLMVAATGMYLMQAGWFYTQYPFIALSLVAAIAVSARLISTVQRIHDVKARVLVICVLSCMMGEGLVVNFAAPAISRAAWDVKYTREFGHTLANDAMQRIAAEDMEPHLASHPRFMLLTNNMRAVNLQKPGTPRTNVGRFDYLWPVAGIKMLENDPARHAVFERMAGMFILSLAQDVSDHKPDMVINDVSVFQYGLPARYNLIDWLKRDSRFAAAWEDYKLVDSFDHCSVYEPNNCAYEIYYRQ